MRAAAPVVVVLISTAAFVAPFGTTGGVARGDIVHLNDGRSIEGDVKRTAEGWSVVVDGQTTQFTQEQVKSIEVGTSAAGPLKDGGLASLRRSMANVTDPQQAVERYKRFIANAEKSAPPTAIELARADLLIWQDRADRKLVKLGDQWVTSAQADTARAKAVAELSTARDLMLEGRAKDALAMVEAALVADPQNATALYLRGVQAYADGDVPLARRSFDAAVAALPGAHGPTYNNLAVVLMRQNQPAAALTAYARALQSPEADPRVLDNVAEALNSTATDTKLAPAVKKTAAVFQPIDIAVAGHMARQGLYRWGATWIPKAELERLQALEKQVNEQIARFEVDFGTAQDEMRRIESEIAANERAMRRMEANATFRDELTGRIVRTELPRSYYALQRDNIDLVNERQRVTARIDQLRTDAKAARAKLPKPRYTGAQRLIGPEGAPGLPEPKRTPADPSPATAPATSPAPPATVPAPLLPMSPLLPR
jgi:tetratricopeptide (TPR) repeat protein